MVDPNTLIPHLPLPPNVENLRDRPLFKTHPLLDTYETGSHQEIPRQFHAYNADNTTIVGLANLEKARDYLAPIGYKPVTVHPDAEFLKKLGLADESCAIVNLVMNDYKDTSLGKYQAFPLCFFATRDGLSVEWLDVTSTLVPLLESSVAMIMGPLAMSENQKALDIGREQMGINKFKTDATIDHDDKGTTALIVHRGKEVLRATVTDAGPLQALLEGAELFKNVGLLASLSMLIDPDEPVNHTFIGWDPKAAPLLPAVCQSFTVTKPAVKPWDDSVDELDIQPGSPLTDALRDLVFKPILSSRDPRISVVVEPDAVATSAIQKRVRDAKVNPGSAVYPYP